MIIEKLLAGLPGLSEAKLKLRLENARRPAMRGREDAARLEAAILAELAGRRRARLKPEGGLWWEPHDADFPHFHGYADAEGTRAVATILKRSPHKGDDKEVYSVEVMGEAIPGTFHHVADARVAGSTAWGARS